MLRNEYEYMNMNIMDTDGTISTSRDGTIHEPPLSTVETSPGCFILSLSLYSTRLKCLGPICFSLLLAPPNLGLHQSFRWLSPDQSVISVTFIVPHRAGVISPSWSEPNLVAFHKPGSRISFQGE